MWIIILGIICEAIIGGYTTCWFYPQNKWYSLVVALLTIAIMLGTWTTLK